MKRIKDIVTKPSEALQAMVDGLLKQSKRRNFCIDMGTFGDSIGNICFGCAATCAVQEIAKRNFTPGDTLGGIVSRASILGFEPDELNSFEYVINDAREGHMRNLFNFYSIPIGDEDGLLYADFELDSDHWKSQIPEVEEYIAKIKALGY